MPKVISAFNRGEGVQQPADGRVQGLLATCSGCSQQCLDLGEYLFNGVERWVVRQQVTHLSTVSVNVLADACHLVRLEAIHHHIAWLELGLELLFDPSQKCRSIDRAL